MFFDGWQDIVRILVVGTCGYAGLVLLLRLTGKRTLAKMNAFDFLVTIALGSILATLLLDRNVSLSEGVFAFAWLCALQYAVAFLSSRSKGFERLVKSQPSLLLYRGQALTASLKNERITEEELLAAVRRCGINTLKKVGAVVLETDGSISVLPDPVAMSNEIMKPVRVPSHEITEH